MINKPVYIDSQLLKKYSKNTAEAFTIVYKKYSPEFYCFGKQVVSHYAKDLVADLFTQLWTFKKTAENEGAYPFSYHTNTYRINLNMSITSMTYGAPQNLIKGISDTLRSLSIDDSRAMTLPFHTAELLLEPLHCTVKNLSILHMNWQGLVKEDTFHIQTAPRYSFLIVLSGSVVLRPAAGRPFAPFTLLRGQFAWLPLNPSDFYMSVQGSKNCQALELHYSSTLPVSRENIVPFQNWWCGMLVLEAIYQLFKEPSGLLSSPLLASRVEEVALTAKLPRITSPALIERLFEARDYLYDNRRKDLDLYTLLVQIGSNANALRLEFLEVFGKTVFYYHEYLRIEEAKSLFRRNEYSVKSVRILLGYKRWATFINAFKRQTGLTPGNWIRNELTK